MRNFILLLILFAAGLESASAQRTGLFRKRRAYNAPAFNVTRFSEKTPQTASAKDSTAADSIRRQAVAQQRPAKDSAAIAGNKADAPSKAKPASTVDSVGRSSSRSRQSRDLQSGQFFAENDQNDSTIVILRNGQVQEVRIRDGNVIIRNETAEPPLNVGKPVPLPRPISAPIYAPDTLDEVNLAERDSAATQTEAAPGIRKISPRSQIPQPAGTAPAKAKRPVAKPSPARPAPRQAPRRDSLRGNTEADTSARQPMATDSTDIRLGQNLDALQARLSEMEKRLSAQQDSARPDAGNRRAKRLEEDSVYVSNTRRSEALQRRLDSLDNQRQLDSDTRQPFRERVAGWWQRNFGGKKNRKTAEVDTSAARPPGSNVRPDASGRRGNNEDARQQTYARRDSLQRELARLNNDTETRRMAYRQPVPQPNPDNAAYAEDVRQLRQYTEQLRESLEEQRRLNREMNRELRAANREAAVSRTARVRQENVAVRRVRDEADDDRRTRTQPAERRTGVAAVLGLGNRREKAKNEDVVDNTARTAQNEAELRRLTRQLDSLQGSLASNTRRDTSANVQNVSQQQLRALTDSIGALKNRLEQLRDAEQPAVSGSAFDASLLPAVPVFFELGGTKLSANAVRRISQVATTLRKYPEARVVLTGMADATGNPTVNRRVSEQRAQAVKRLLTESYGIAEERIEIEAAGSENATGKRNPLDRRVEMRFVQP